jgi:pimeloyl-ACP methyl ester carboxylesterase
MSAANINRIHMAYDTFGDQKTTPLLLIMGLGAQMILWDEKFCEDLANQGLYVIRFDNRDVGLSTHFDDAGIPDLMAVFTAQMQGEKIDTPYTLDDMADDAVRLLKTIGIEKAHICGVSLGASIAQTIAIRHPSNVLSLILISGSTGNPALPPPTPEAMNLLIAPQPKERTAFVEHLTNTYKMIAGSGSPFDEEWHRIKLAQSYDRSFNPNGKVRQLAAAIAHGNRKPALANVNTPTLVIHGTEDPLVPADGGKDTAEAINGAELLLIDGMGHELPNGKGAWPDIMEAMIAHIKKVGSNG